MVGKGVLVCCITSLRKWSTNLGSKASSNNWYLTIGVPAWNWKKQQTGATLCVIGGLMIWEIQQPYECLCTGNPVYERCPLKWPGVRFESTLLTQAGLLLFPDFDVHIRTQITNSSFRSLDNNECLLSTHTCDRNATCTNTGGSFDCACNSGFQGNGHTCASKSRAMTKRVAAEKKRACVSLWPVWTVRKADWVHPFFFFFFFFFLHVNSNPGV